MRCEWLAAVAACACSPSPAPPTPPTETPIAVAPEPTAMAVVSPTPPATTPTPPPEPPRAPLPNAGQLVSLPVAGHGDAIVAVPASGSSPRPLLVATHGNYDGPEWQCREWQRIAGDAVFILCPRGIARRDSPSPDDTRFTYVNNAALEQELDAAIAALKARFEDAVDTTAAVYTGFSLGAILGVKIAARRPDLYPRLALVEGGFEEWTAARAKAFVGGGGKRVLFLCGQKPCEVTARHLGKELEKLGVAVHVAASPGLGHTYGGPMTELARAELPWLVEDDPRWAEQ